MHNAPAPSTQATCAHCGEATSDFNIGIFDVRLFVAIDAETGERTNLHFGCVDKFEAAWVESNESEG